MKNIIQCSLLLVFLGTVLASCQMQKPINIKKHDGKIPIVTTNNTLAIHTKMIAGEKAFVIALNSPKNVLSPSEKELIYDSGVIISDFPLSGGPLEKDLQKYTGTYLNIRAGESARQNPAKITETITDIEKIRNTLSELDPTNTGFYYDNAGTYIHLLHDTYDKLNSRIKEYNRLPFITVGEDMSDFIGDFGLQKYEVWHFKNFDNFIPFITKISEIEKKNPVHIIFTEISPSKQILEVLKKKFNIHVYTFANMDDDISNWGYLRFIEKRINTFVEAYDTYD